MKKIAFVLALATIVSLVACRKERETFDNTVARDNQVAETYFSDLYKVVEDISANTEGIRYYSLGCIDTVIVDTTSTPRSVLIDFGNDDCVGTDGRIRKGTILVTYSGRYREVGTVITVTPQTYTVNGYAITGTKTITNAGTNTQGQPYFTIEVNGTITAPANAYDITWQSTRTRTWVEGYNTLALLDDAYEITGSASGVNRFGNPYTMNITSALRAEIGCPWLVRGVFTITPEDGEMRSINFGSGDCNAGYVITVNGTDYPINGGN